MRQVRGRRAGALFQNQPPLGAVVPQRRILAQPVDRTTLDALDDDTRRDLLSLLRSWLIDHIIKEDLQLRPWLERFPRDWNPADAPSFFPEKTHQTATPG